MINRIIDFSINNKTVVFLLVALAGLADGGRSRRLRSMPSRT
jgi:hypothetical protein